MVNCVLAFNVLEATRFSADTDNYFRVSMTSFNETSLSRFPNKFQGTKELKVSSFAEYINTFSTPLASVYSSENE